MPSLERRRLFSISHQTEASQMQYLKKKKAAWLTGKTKVSLGSGSCFSADTKHAADLQQQQQQPWSPDGCFPPFCIYSSLSRTASGRGRKEPSSRQVQFQPRSNKSLLVWIQGPRMAAGIFMDPSSRKDTLLVSVQVRLMQHHGRRNTTKY